VGPGEGRTWRIAHLSDIHVVGERYGFRIESGRSGPRGNERLRLALQQLEVIDGNDPLDAMRESKNPFFKTLKNYPRGNSESRRNPQLLGVGLGSFFRRGGAKGATPASMSPCRFDNFYHPN
jgi:hypothetical protein